MLIVADSKIPHADSAFKRLGDVEVVPTKQMTRDRVKTADAILIRSETKIDKVFLNGTNIRFVGTATIGTDHVDVEYLAQNNIAFASCPGSNANSVGEYILAALLEVGARLGLSLRGTTLGVVGHGNTGSRVATKAEAIGMTVLLNDPPLARRTGDSRYVPLDALMEADVVSLHVPLTKRGEDATYHLFDERRLSSMKKGSILINSSRGAIVDNAALKTVLQTKHLRACVLDVWENEPAIDIELLQLVAFGTPHVAGYSHDGKLNATTMLQQALSEYCGTQISEPMKFDVAELKSICTPESVIEEEDRLRYAVRQCYDISQDDQRLRTLVDMPEAQRADFFRGLRSKYPTRREFHNYIVSVKDVSSSFSDTLSSVGFNIQPLS